MSKHKSWSIAQKQAVCEVLDLLYQTLPGEQAYWLTWSGREEIAEKLGETIRFDEERGEFQY